MAAVLSPILSPPKVVLLAAQFAATGAVASLAALTAHYRDNVLTTELLLRLLLTYLPTHLPTAAYLPLLESLVSGDFSVFFPLPTVDTASINSLSDEQAAKKVRRLRLRPLDGGEGNTTRTNGANGTNGDSPKDWDLLSSFLLLRAYAVDDGAGALPELPALVAPFLDRDPTNRLRTWAVSTLLPLLRRNCEYYPDQSLAQTTLADFEHLPDRVAVARLLSQTGQDMAREENHDDRTTDGLIGRDLRGMIGPWLHNERRWPRRRDPASAKEEDTTALCPGWEEVLRWLVAQAAGPSSWRVAVAAIEQWDGPGDVDLGGFGSQSLWLAGDEQQYLIRRYAQAALASVYVIPKASAETLNHAHGVVAKVRALLGIEAAATAHVATPHLQTAASLLPPVSTATAQLTAVHSGRRDLLSTDRLLDPPDNNPLTAPTAVATELLLALVLSAHLLTSRLGCPCTVRRAADLALLLRGGRDDQTAEADKALRWMAGNGPKGEDRYWIKARNEILWLRDWGADEHDDEAENKNKPDQPGPGVFGHVSREYIETEFLKALLANTRYTLARALYEDAPDHPLPKNVVRDTIFATVMSTYDNASNPNRTRGGLKKCDAIMRAFPRTIPPSLPEAKRTEALLTATHALGMYRLVLKQGEPFTPVVLRVHPDPIAILGKVLEQNPKSYTHIRALVDIAQSLVAAGLTRPTAASAPAIVAVPQDMETQRVLAERRVTAMCIDAALDENDFETAYSYVVGRMSASNHDAAIAADTWSWRAALEAGRYRRSERTVRPTHLGTASANLEIRHLEQRIDCLATALRIAPVDTLQEILNAYRRAEEELEVAVQDEAQQEAAWDEAGDWQQQPQQPPTEAAYHVHRSQTGAEAMPGGFKRPPRAATTAGLPPASRAAAAAAASAAAASAQQAAADEAPLSLFDLSRATARVAQRNLSALASLRQTRQAVFGSSSGDSGSETKAAPAPATAPTTTAGLSPAEDSEREASSTATTPLRKRDQLREAAMGTLTSGVSWLIGAQPVDRERLRTEE